MDHPKNEFADRNRKSENPNDRAVDERQSSTVDDQQLEHLAGGGYWWSNKKRQEELGTSE